MQSPTRNDTDGFATLPLETWGTVLRSLLIGIGLPPAAAVSLSVALGGQRITTIGLLLVASGTMAAYALDRLIDRQDNDSNQLRRIVLVCVVVSSVIAGTLACTTWWRFQICCMLGFISGAYVPLKQFIPKNVLTTIAWTTATATLPFEGQPPLDPLFGASVLAVAFIVLANTVLCDVPDFAMDRQSGVRGITPRFGPYAGAKASTICGGLGAVIAFASGRWGLALTSLGLCILAILIIKQRDQRPLRLLADVLVTFLPGPIAFLFR